MDSYSFVPQQPPLPFYADPNDLPEDADKNARTRARCSKDFLAASARFPTTSAPDKLWRQFWINIRDSVVSLSLLAPRLCLNYFQESFDAVHLGTDGIVRHRPPEISRSLDNVMRHLRDHYDPAWSWWARDDLVRYFPDVHFPAGTTDDPTLEEGWDSVPASSLSRSTSISHSTTPDLSVPSQSSRGRKRTTVARPSPPSETVATSPPRKRSRSKTGPEDARPSLPPFDAYTIPSPFPRALFPDNIRILRETKQEARWVEAAKREGLLNNPVSPPNLSLDTDLTLAPSAV
jgi:hypothetical protein